MFLFFDDNWNKAKFKIGAIEPSGYTRIGTALRHSGELLSKRSTKNKWVILLSDGKPNDYDRYEGAYGINDVKQALRELNAQNINSYALAIEAQAKYYLPQMFGQNHYQILTTPVELLRSLVKLYLWEIIQIHYLIVVTIYMYLMVLEVICMLILEYYNKVYEYSQFHLIKKTSTILQEEFYCGLLFF